MKLYEEDEILSDDTDSEEDEMSEEDKERISFVESVTRLCEYTYGNVDEIKAFRNFYPDFFKDTDVELYCDELDVFLRDFIHDDNEYYQWSVSVCFSIVQKEGNLQHGLFIGNGRKTLSLMVNATNNIDYLRIINPLGLNTCNELYSDFTKICPMENVDFSMGMDFETFSLFDKIEELSNKNLSFRYVYINFDEVDIEEKNREALLYKILEYFGCTDERMDVVLDGEHNIDIEKVKQDFSSLNRLVIYNLDEIKYTARIFYALGYDSINLCTARCNSVFLGNGKTITEYAKLCLAYNESTSTDYIFFDDMEFVNELPQISFYKRASSFSDLEYSNDRLIYFYIEKEDFNEVLQDIENIQANFKEHKIYVFTKSPFSNLIYRKICEYKKIETYRIYFINLYSQLGYRLFDRNHFNECASITSRLKRSIMDGELFSSYLLCSQVKYLESLNEDYFGDVLYFDTIRNFSYLNNFDFLDVEYYEDIFETSSYCKESVFDIIYRNTTIQNSLIMKKLLSISDKTMFYINPQVLYLENLIFNVHQVEDSYINYNNLKNIIRKVKAITKNPFVRNAAINQKYKNINQIILSPLLKYLFVKVFIKRSKNSFSCYFFKY